MSTLEYQNSTKVKSTIVVSVLFSIVFFACGISSLAGAFSDQTYKLVRILFWIYGAIFLASTLNLYRGKVKYGTVFMITGGIMTMPIGLIAIIFAVIERNKLVRMGTGSIALIFLASAIVTLFTIPVFYYALNTF